VIAILFSVMLPRDHCLPKHQEHAMELVILALSAGTLVLLAAHLIDYASESKLRSAALLTPDDEIPAHDAPLPFEDACILSSANQNFFLCG
jgi:hypothetical protein